MAASKCHENNLFAVFLAYKCVLIYLVAVIFSQICLTLCCDVAVRAAENLLVACYGVQERFKSSSDEHKELEIFANKLINRKIKFTAANYFDLNRSTVFAIFWNIATYFVALVQFDDDIPVNREAANTVVGKTN